MPDTNLMLTEERRRPMVEVLHRDGCVHVTDLAKRVVTSQIRIGRDLEARGEE